MTPPMFTPLALRGLTVPNRVAVSPMCMYSADDGTPNDFHLVHLGGFAMGGAGLVFTEMTDVNREGRITDGCAGMYKPEHVAAWRRIVDFVHNTTASKIGIQLSHAGRKGSTKKMWEASNEPRDDGNWPLVAPSPLPLLPHSQVPREMTKADIAQLRDDFVRAARMSDEAGFDILELHFAHGYLVSSFISPLTNHRTDEYGGSLENRMRLALEIFHAVRAVWPERKPISVRISAVDWIDGGTTIDDAVDIARLLKKAGLDILDVSTGSVTAEPRPRMSGLFQTPFSARIRREIGIPTITVGAFASPHEMNRVIDNSEADLCMMARGHLYDPFYTRHAARALGYKGLPWPKQYIAADVFTSPWMLPPPGNA